MPIQTTQTAEPPISQRLLPWVGSVNRNEGGDSERTRGLYEFRPNRHQPGSSAFSAGDFEYQREHELAHTDIHPTLRGNSLGHYER